MLYHLARFYDEWPGEHYEDSKLPRCAEGVARWTGFEPRDRHPMGREEGLAASGSVELPGVELQNPRDADDLRPVGPRLDLLPRPEPVQIVGPGLHHHAPLGQERRPVVGPTVGSRAGTPAPRPESCVPSPGIRASSSAPSGCPTPGTRSRACHGSSAVPGRENARSGRRSGGAPSPRQPRAPGQPRGEVAKKAYRPYRTPGKCLTSRALRPVRWARFRRTAV